MVYDQYIDIESEWRVIFDNNWESLRDKVFNIIREPLLNEKI